MASGSGKDQDDIQDPIHGQDEESNAAAVTVAELPPPAPPVMHIQEHVHDRPGDGGDGESPSTAAAVAAERKGKKVMVSSPPSSAGSSPPITSPVVSVSEAGELSSIAMVDSVRRRVTVSWREPVVEGVVAVLKVARPIDLKNMFETLVLEQKAIRDLDWRLAEPDEMKKQEVGDWMNFTNSGEPRGEHKLSSRVTGSHNSDNAQGSKEITCSILRTVYFPGRKHERTADRYENKRGLSLEHDGVPKIKD